MILRMPSCHNKQVISYCHLIILVALPQWRTNNKLTVLRIGNTVPV